MPPKLFDAPDAITRDTIEGLQGTTSLEFRSLMCLLLDQGLLDAILAVPQNGKPMSKYEALIWWSAHFAELERTVVSCCDMSRGRPQALNRLTREIRDMRADKGTITRIQQHLGGYTHAAVLNYLQGGNRHIVSVTHAIKSTNIELFLSDNQTTHQIPLLHDEQEIEYDEVCDINALRDIWNACIKPQSWIYQPLVNFLATRNHIPRLISLLRPMYGVFLDKILADPSPANQYYGYYTLLTLASVVLHRDTFDVGQIVTQEKRVIHNHQISLGRVDACTGRGIDDERMPYIREYDGRSKSVAELAVLLQPLQLEVLDIKCSVGDYEEPNRDRAIPYDIERGELPSHVHQLRRYLVMIPLAEYLQSNGFYADLYDPRAIWHKDSCGSLMYLFPECEPIIRRQSMNADEKIEWYRTHYVDQWDEFQNNANMRTLANRIVNQTLRARSGHDVCTIMPKVEQSCLFDDPHAVPFGEILNHHRNQFAVFHDPRTRIIESRGEDKHGKVGLLHLGQLCELIAQKKVVVSKWDEQGGTISCPIHGRDSDPSLNIEFQRNWFWCYGCGVHGKIDRTDVPDGISVNFSRVVKPDVSNIKVSPEHHRIMSDTHMLLQQMYLGESDDGGMDAWEYLATVRGHDPYHAYELGAGYGCNNVISALLDKWTLTQLVYYGLVAFSTKIKTVDYSILQLLCRHGKRMTPSGICRNKQYNVNGETIEIACEGLPYFPLHNRVTFPLMVGQRMSSFYGRAIWKNPKVPHIKLPRKHHNTPPGGWNTGVLADPRIKHVSVTEAVIDGLALDRLCGYPIGIIGTGNGTTIREIAVAQKENIYLGFDNEELSPEELTLYKKTGKPDLPPGQLATERTAKLLRDFGYKGLISYLTHQTLGSSNPIWKAPNGSDFKDFGAWWKDMGRFLF